MNKIKILGLSGKKQSGKDTTANYIVGHTLKGLKVTSDFSITKDGKLFVTDVFGNKAYKGILDLDSRHPEYLAFAEEHIYPFVKTYSYADVLKQKVCIDVLGLTYEQCYGTNEEKNNLTHLKWENMPGITTNPHMLQIGAVDLGCKTFGVTYHEPGSMTAREVMQYVGTEIFRKMYGNVWVDATIKQIKTDEPILAIIRDVRFPNEIVGIEKDKEIEGQILRYLRDIYKGQDQHESETALDDYKFSKKTIIIDNQEMTIDEQNLFAHVKLAQKKWVEPISIKEAITV